MSAALPISLSNVSSHSEHETIDEIQLYSKPVAIKRFPRLRNFFKRISNIFKGGNNRCFGTCIPRSTIYVYTNESTHITDLYAPNINISIASTIIPAP